MRIASDVIIVFFNCTLSVALANCRNGKSALHRRFANIVSHFALVIDLFKSVLFCLSVNDNQISLTDFCLIEEDTFTTFGNSNMAVCG